MRQSSGLVIAIDGPAGSGKSTVARQLAQRLGLKYIDTGAMYRALTLKAMRRGVNLEDEDALCRLFDQTTIDLVPESDALRVLLDGQDVSEAIRDPDVTRKTFYAARSSSVRALMVAAQQRMGEKGGVVAEGRDATTVIFPNATKKIYLDARLDVRARRRLADLARNAPPLPPTDFAARPGSRSALRPADRSTVAAKSSLEQVQAEMRERDRKDLTRAVGPLRRVPDALYLDTSDLSIEQTVARILAFVGTEET